jgi:tRNA1Val (adenine37-N6)-methyltransferase
MHRWRERIASVSAFEIQPQLCDLICQNFRINAFENACFCVQGDVKTILNHLEPESFSQVICNPPFYRPENGRQNKNSESMIARHQIAATLMDFTKAAAAAVKNGGSVVFVYPAEMFTELADSFLGMRLEIKNLQFVYSYSDTNDEARLVLVRCVKNGGRGVKVAPPFYIYARKNGQFSKEMQRLYAPVYPVVE